LIEGRRDGRVRTSWDCRRHRLTGTVQAPLLEREDTRRKRRSWLQIGREATLRITGTRFGRRRAAESIRPGLRRIGRVGQSKVHARVDVVENCEKLIGVQKTLMPEEYSPESFGQRRERATSISTMSPPVTASEGSLICRMMDLAVPRPPALRPGHQARADRAPESVVEGCYYVEGTPGRGVCTRSHRP